MEELKGKLPIFLSKYKYVALVVVAGIILMLLPTAAVQESSPVQVPTQVIQDPEKQLEDILSRIAGVGKVQVLLSVARGQETVYAYDRDSSDAADSNTQRESLVVITGEDRGQNGLVRQIIGPEYQGAIVVCQGGDQSAVRLAVVEAVCAATGLPTHKVSVLKMK